MDMTRVYTRSPSGIKPFDVTTHRAAFSVNSIFLRPYQEVAAEALREAYRRSYKAPLLVLPTGGGKCLAAGTPVMMFDGRVKPVEQVRVGELLMGPDSQPRRVESLACGREEMFRVIPTKGEPYTVNRSHILSLRMTGGSLHSCGIPDGTVVNLTVADYLERTKTFKHCAKGWRTAVDFPAHTEPMRLDPYFVGVWLGDGTSRSAAITTGDPEIVHAVTEYATSVGLRVREEKNSVGSVILHATTEERGPGHGHRSNPISLALHQYRMLGNKHIPHRYLTAARADRLEVLAGIIDTDGSWTGKGFDVCLKSERLFDDLVFLARSLGFSAYKAAAIKTCGNNGIVGDYWRCCISGDIDAIPCRIARKRATARLQIKNHLVTGIRVESVGDGDYYGFELSGPDRLFLLGDFTVTHNTVVFSYIAREAAAKGRRVLILAHRRELIRQASRKLSETGVAHGIIAPGFTPSRELTQVASVQTLARRIDQMPLFDLIVIDEAHHAVAGQWKRIIETQPKAKLLGVTATPERMDGKGLGKMVGGCFDQITLGPSVSDLVRDGFLCPAKVYAPADAPDLTGVRIKGGDYDPRQLEQRINVKTITGDVLDHWQRLASGLPTIAFCISVQHAEDVAATFREAGVRSVCGHGGLTPAKRDAAINGLVNGSVQVLTTCDLISEGLDVPVVGACILLRPTKSLGLYLQQVGRGLRTAPGKSHLVILDHAGCAAIHGLPDTERDWRLTGKVKSAKPDTTWQCPQCNLVQKSAPACVECGYATTSDDDDEEKQGRALQHVDGELVELDARRVDEARREQRHSYLRHARLTTLLQSAHTDDDLREIAAARGYKAGWVWHIKQQRVLQQPVEGSAA